MKIFNWLNKIKWNIERKDLIHKKEKTIRSVEEIIHKKNHIYNKMLDFELKNQMNEFLESRVIVKTLGWVLGDE